MVAAAVALAAPSARADVDGAATGFEDSEDGGIGDTDGAAGEGTESAEEPAGPAVDYTVTLTGVDDDDMRDIMERVMQLNSLQDRPPATLAGLGRRTEGDIERLRTVLRSQGYWDGTVKASVDRDAKPVAVTLTVDKGKLFRFGTYDIRFVDTDDPPKAPTPADLGFVTGAPARGEDILKAGRELFQRLAVDARPLAKRVDRVITVDHRNNTVDVSVVIDPGPPARFGPVTFQGLERTSESYVQEWITWQQGDPWDQSAVNTFRLGLSGTGLFGSVIVKTPDHVDAKDELPITVVVTEAKPRSIGASVSYSTDRGLGGKVFWRHRNLFGHNENFEATVSADFLQQGVSVEFTRPNFKKLDQTLFATADAARDETDAYSGYEANAELGMIWALADRWRFATSGTLAWSNLDSADGRQSSLLFRLPLTLSYRGSDNELNPTEGVRFDLGVSPAVGEASKALLFNESSAELRAYQPLDEEHRYVLAGRVELASIVGEETSDIPANARLYAGGGGSIRGYAYQTVGPLDADNNPLGGRSRIELSGEFRMRVWGDFGVVPFVDAGNVYNSEFPSFDEPLQWAAGIGFRYYSIAGPLRLDVAFPINRRPNIDDPFQLYISLGQAF